jgi:hypothetical protein
MKNLLVYYLSIISPLAVLALLLFEGMKVEFVIGILVYASVYRPVTDGFRLLAKGKIQKDEFWKLFIPFWSIQWFKSLYC